MIKIEVATVSLTETTVRELYNALQKIDRGEIINASGVLVSSEFSEISFEIALDNGRQESLGYTPDANLKCGCYKRCNSYGENELSARLEEMIENVNRVLVQSDNFYNFVKKANLFKKLGSDLATNVHAELRGVDYNLMQAKKALDIVAKIWGSEGIGK